MHMKIIMNAMVLIVLQPPSQAATGFAVYPSNVTVLTGSEALFRCRHQSADVTWTVNGSSAVSFPDVIPTSNRDSGVLVYTLIIPAKSAYNGVEVVCRAIIDNVIETTPPVTLTVVEVSTMETTTISISTETTRVENPTAITDQIETTTMAPMTTVTSVIEKFSEYPSDFAVLLDSGTGIKAMFRCRHESANAINWIVNGTLYDIGRFPDITKAPINEDGVQVNTLTIPARSEYNGTEVVCEAFFRTRSSESTSPARLLIMSGPLQNVVNLIREGSTISWEPPFSLDLTGIDPDIVYCVEVYNITCGRRDLIISDCNMTEPSYTSDDIAPDGYIYEYTVTPRSNVEGASNGRSITVEEQFMKVISMGHTVSMMNVSKRGLSGSDDNYTRVVIHLDVHQEAIRPASYSISLESLDGIQTHDNFSNAMVLSNEESSILLKVVSLPFRRLWSTTIFAHDCDDHPLSPAMELGTHDFHNITITSPRPGVVMVTGDTIQGSPSIGILVIIYSLTNDFNVHYCFAKYTDMQQPVVHPTVVGLPEDEYSVIVFVMEENGRPFSRAAATPRSVQINGPVEAQPLPIEYDLQSTSTGTCVNCTFLDSSTTDCVAVVHQRISQLSSSGLRNIESSHKFDRSDDSAYGCIEGVNLTYYQVGVIGGRRIPALLRNSTQCTTGCIVGIIVLVAVILMILIILSIIAVLAMRRRKSRGPYATPDTATAVGMSQSKNQYETVPLRIQSDGGRDTQLEVDATAASSPLEGDDHSPTAIASHIISGEGPSSTAPPLPSPRCTADPVYAETVIVSCSKTVPAPPPAADMVVYDDITAFQNKDGQHYAIIANLKTSGKFLYDQNNPVYSDIQHVFSSHQVQPTKISPQNITSTQLNEDATGPTPTLFTLEHLLPELLPIAAKWQALGEALSLDEDRLDEIFTNNETDEACLTAMLELYMARSDFNHNWEEIQGANCSYMLAYKSSLCL